MTDFSRDHYVKLVEQDYFGSVARHDKAAILACFTDDARVTIYHGDNRPRRFQGKAASGESPLPSFFDHLLANYDPEFTEFTHFVDAENARCAATFKVTLTPTADSAYRDAGVQVLRNCNFFECRDGKIHDMIIYYANPGAAGAAEPAPTGFPQAR